jgi:serine/threonine protein phosphatase PrpC
MTEEQTRRPGPQAQGAENAQMPVSPPSLDLVAAKLTDVGRVRPHNEDYVDYYIPPDSRQLARKGAIYLVADGMGGHQAGEVASHDAVELVIGQYYSDTTHDVGTSLVRAFRAANQQIHAQAQSDPSKGGMGTTLVAAVVLGRKVYMANVGDSRAYLINKKGIAQITEDHSWVEEQVRAGLLTPEQAKRHPQRNLVTRALGSKPAVEADLFEGEINAGDTLLLCSDGLTGRVEDHELMAIVREHPPQKAAQLLVDLANERGGNDNITVLIVSAHEEPATVKAPVLVPAKKEPARKFPLVPVLGGVAAVLVLVLGVLVGMPIIKGILGPKPTATPLPPASPAVPTVTVTLDAGVISTPEAGVISTPTETLPPTPLEGVQPTSTLAQLPPTTTPSPTRQEKSPPTATRTPTGTPETRQPAPTLLDPTPDAKLNGQVTFRWEYPRALRTHEAFQVLIWREGETQHNGAARFVRALEQTIDLDHVQQLAAAGQYLWSVVLVDKNADKRISPESDAWPFEYIGPQSPGGQPTKEGPEPPPYDPPPVAPSAPPPPP